MKKIILTASSLCLLSMAANAQAGSWYVGGDVGFKSTKNTTEVNGTKFDGAQTTSWLLSPEIGTFLSDNVQVGVQLNFGGQKVDANDAAKTIDRKSSFGGTLYGRYFFGEGAFRPFAGVNVSVLPGTVKSENVLISTKATSMDFGANLNVGFAYALNNRVTAVGSFGALGYSNSSTKAGSTKTTTQSFGFDKAGTLGNRFTIGIYYTL